MSPWPGAFATLRGKVVKVHEATASDLTSPCARPGQVVLADKTGLVVACGDGSVALARVQLEGKKPIRGVDWIAGRGVAEGDTFSAATTE